MIDPQDAASIRLIVTDMDGTLLDDSGNLPPRWDEVARRMHRCGIAFAPASGRQYDALAALFDATSDAFFIAENGAHVVHDGTLVSAAPVPRPVVLAVAETVRGLQAPAYDVGAVLCGLRSAYIERHDDPFVTQVGRYFRSLTVVDRFEDVEDEIVKISIYDFLAPDSDTGSRLAAAASGCTVGAGARHWIDVQRSDVDKGTALRTLQERLGVTSAQTVVFGDYLNDLPLFEAADHTYAMANAHPAVRERARYSAPGNSEHGVATTIRALLDAAQPAAGAFARSRQG